MGQLMEDIVSTANNFAENFKEEGDYDFSIKSLELVDEYLDELGDFDLDENAIFNISSMIGCYVFETARRNYGGEYKWSKEKQHPVLVAGAPNFSVAICAWDKVKGRLLKGSEDNIPFYIAGYKEHIEKGRQQKGYNVVIF
ncbi:MAG: hypothetical protein K2H91_04945 [Lachnospiraceae bacterium]|nr:hypothetical protein [Lachnospiraceae bacterium]